MKFQVEFTSRSIRDLKKLSKDSQSSVLDQLLLLESKPFQFKAKIKRARGIKFPCFRLHLDLKEDSFRVFYGIDKNIIYILEIVTKKEADKIIKRLRQKEFPPNT